jgi:hypothetical protein
MRSLLAVVAGCVFIVVVILLLQLAYIFIAVGYNALAVDFPFLNDIVCLFRYLVGIPVLIITMFAGGFITANIADVRSNIKVLSHCLVVGGATAGGMMYYAMEKADITLTGIVVIVLALGASSAGGLYWLRNNN